MLKLMQTFCLIVCFAALAALLILSVQPPIWNP